LQSISSL
jgi:hypothetical protein